MEKKAVIFTIGNEILSGDVLDENSNWIAKRLFSHGIDLSFIFVLPDNSDIISEFIKTYKDKYDYIITIGGMGPTPDDVTKEAVAKVFGVELSINKDVENLINNYFQDKVTKEKFLMAIFPETSEPIYTSDKLWAVGLKISNVFSFPGTPSLVRDSFPSIEHIFNSSPIYKTKISVNCEETRFADIMSFLINDFPGVSIGSYPSEDNFRKVKIIFKSRDKFKIQQCREKFVKILTERFSDLEIS